MQKDYLVPASIVIGCTIIGAGLFFGLRGQQPPAPVAASTAAAAVQPPGQPPATPPAPVTAPAPGPVAQMPAGLSMPGVPPAVQAAVEKAAAEALAAEKKNVLLPKCYDPAIASSPEPRIAKFTLDMTFDPNGIQITRGLSEERDALRPDVANCIRALPMSLRVPPPGVPVRVNLPLVLP